jgi:hypothetical protein
MAMELFYRLATSVQICRFPGMGVMSSRAIRLESYARMKELHHRSTFVPFRVLVGDVCAIVHREFLQCLSVVAHSTLGFYRQDALQEGSVDALACLPAPRARAGFFLFLFFP